MKTVSVALQAHLKSTPTTVCTMWKITRQDSQVFTFTEHDEDITYNGLLYKSTGGFNKSAIKSSGSFATDNMEVNGFLSDDTIADDEIRNGAFDFAEVEIFLINYRDFTMGELKLRYGFFGEVRTAPSGMFLVELRGLIDLLSVKIGDVYVPECRVDLGSVKCGVKLSPDEFRIGRTYPLDSRVLVALDSVNIRPKTHIGPINGGFETGTISGWTGGTVEVSSGMLNLDPIEGSEYFLRFRSSSYIRQNMNLAVGNVSIADIDTGRLKIKTECVAAAIEYGASVSFSYTFFKGLNGTGAVVSIAISEYGLLTPERNWRPVSHTVTIPNSARSVRISPFVSGLLPHSTPDVGFDNFNCHIEFDNGITDYSIYGGVEFKLTTEGVPGTTMPAFNPTIGATTPDGDAVWTAVYPQHMFLDAVAENSVLSTQIKTTNLNVPNDWINWGVLKFLTGDNIGRAIEPISWNNTTKIMTLALPMPNQPKAGDVFVVHTGCDKSRGVCNLKFGNIINFRGEPDVPGLNQYFRVAGMGR